jgi:nucleoside-diphosphate-sugar epimerase
MKQRILITGAGGRVGREIIPLLRKHYALRLLDASPKSRLTVPLETSDEFVRADIRDLAAMRQACRNVAAMVHLAAIPDEDDFQTRLLPMNLEGVYSAFEAARLAGLRKVIFVSTCQTVLNYAKGEWVTTEMPPRPSTVYACTKLFGEALARHYTEKHGLAIIVIRLAFFQGYDSPLLRQRGDIQREWCSPRDLTQLLVKSLRSRVRFAIFFGVSKNTGRFWDIRNARKLVGYEPVDNAADYYGQARGKRGRR